jgi:hypothetical protein
MQAVIKVSEDAPRGEHDFEQSMHKTFTDVYFAKEVGFVGGGWSYALNSNQPDGAVLSDDIDAEVPEMERRLAYYVIGWNSIKVSNRGLFCEQPADHHP